MSKGKTEIPASAEATTGKAKSKNKTKTEKTDKPVEKPKDDFQSIREKVMSELLKFFKPELVNRFDEVTVFEPLKFEHMAQIVKLQLKAVGKLLEDQEIGFYFVDEVIEEIVQAGFDPIYGARPLKRAIQKMIENPISNLIIESKVKMGDVIRIRAEKGNLVFEIEKTKMVEKNFQKYTCKDCGNNFENEVVKNSTTICPKCGKHHVEKFVAPPPPTEEKKPEKTDNPEKTVSPTEVTKNPTVKDNKSNEKPTTNTVG